MTDSNRQLIEGFNAVTNDVSDSFGRLTAEQLNWKPGPGSWSVAQCLDHLIRTNEEYLLRMRAVIDGSYVAGFWSRIPFLPGLIGQMIKRAVDPSNPKKTSTFSVFEPSASDIPGDIVARFKEHQAEMVAAYKELGGIDIRSLKIETPVNKRLFVRLPDALELLVAHERRHFDQAKAVTDHDSFPG